MADLTGTESSLSVKIAGASLTGVETIPVNANPLGSLYIDNRELGGNPIDINIGNASVGTQRVIIASDQPVLTTKGERIETYSAAVVNMIADTLATDVLTIFGSPTKIVKIKLIRFSGTRTVSTNTDVLIVKRSTANTGGTSTVLTNVPHDSTNAASGAIVRVYTINPTLGTLVGLIRSRKTFLNSVGGGPSDDIQWNFDLERAQMPTLNNGNECLSINLNGLTIAGSQINMAIEWIED